MITPFSISHSAPNTSQSNFDLVSNISQSQKDYLLSFKDDLTKRTNLVVKDLNNESIYLLYKEAYIQMAKKYEYAIIPPLIANKERLPSKAFQLYSFSRMSNSEIGFDSTDKNLFWFASKNKGVRKATINSTITNIFQKNISANPLEAPVAIVMNDMVNIFGERVGQFNKKYQSFYNYKGDKIEAEVYTLRFSATQITTDILLKNESIIKVDYEKFSRSYQACWTCRILDYSFDALNYFGYISQKHLMKYIISLMIILFCLKIALKFYDEALGQITSQKGDFKEFVKDIAKKVILVIFALVFIQNINNSLFYYFGRPAVLIGTSMGRFLTEDTKEDKNTCKYFDKKKDNQMLPDLSGTNSSLYDRETETNFFKDKDIDLKKEFICTVYKVQEKNNQIGFFGNIAYKYSDMNPFTSTILWASLWVLTISMSMYIGLKFIDAIFSIGLSVFFAPFAFIAWAIGDDKTFKWLPNLNMKTIINSFIKAGGDIIVMFVGTSMFVSILSTFFTGAPVSLQTIFRDNNYSAAILVNLLEYNAFDFLALIFIFILSATFMERIRIEVGKYIGSINILGYSGSGGHSVTGIEDEVRRYEKGYRKKILEKPKKLAMKKIKKYTAEDNLD